MAKHPELFLIGITLLVTLISNYGSSFTSKPLVVPAQLPQPLFQASSCVLDMYLGDLQPLVDLLHSQDLIFVMYYAPWCARSHAAKAQFLRAAVFLEGQVRFVAVNCWYTEGMCRKQYKFLLYPVFFAYHGNNDGYRYMGIERAEFMVKFLEDLLHPLTLLTSIHHVKDFIAQHDTVVVGHFDFHSSPQPPGFQQFFYASMRVVEHDPHQPIKFAIITNPDLAAYCHLHMPSQIVFLRINNSSLKYPFGNNITASNIVNWVFTYRHKLPVRWVVPLGMKSLMLSSQISKGPAVIMFHRVSPLSPASQTWAVFKDLALRYNQCEDQHLAQDYSRRWLRLSIHSLLQHATALNACRHRPQPDSPPPHTVKCCISTAFHFPGCLQETKLNVCEICHHRSAAQHLDSSACVFKEDRSVEHDTAMRTDLPSNSCFNSIDNYDVTTHTSVCCKCCEQNISAADFLAAPFSSSISESEGLWVHDRRLTDRYVTDSLAKLPRKLCSRLTFQKQQGAFPSAVIPDFASEGLPSGFVGRGCQMNRSLAFITLDSHSHWMFAEHLGVNITQAHLSPVVIVVDKEEETQHVLEEPFSKKSTASFILKFTEGFSRRQLRSVRGPRQEGCRADGSLCVSELTTATLPQALSQPKDLVLLVYAGWCGFCAALSHVFLHLAHYFHTSPNITFARISGDTNDLPWEFTMESYPTIVFFPAFREADSVAFPDSVAMTLPNLIRFVLQQASFTTRLLLAGDVCSAACVRENLQLATHTLRALRARLRHLQARLKAAQTRHRPSPYLASLQEVVKGRISQTRQEVAEVKTLRKLLLDSLGRALDPSSLERLWQHKMRHKDSLART